MENQEDKESDNSSSSEKSHTKRKASSDVTDKGKEPVEQVEQMETEMEITKDDLSKEEEVLQNLLNEWRNLDERFIQEDQKRLYVETFQQYIAKQEKGKVVPEEQQENQKDSRTDQQGQVKGRGKKEEGKILKTPYN